MTDDDLTEDEEKFFDSEGEEAPESLIAEPEPEPEAEPEKEPGEVVEPEPEAEKPPEGMVPHAALHEERKLRQEASEANAQMRERMARMEKTFEDLVSRAQAPAPETADFDDDPAAHLKAGMDAQAEDIEALKGARAATDRARAEEGRFNDFMGAYRAQADEYSAQVTDFGDAYNFLSASRIKEYEISGLSPKDANDYLRRDELEIVAKAMQDGVNPAQRIYEIAQARGYTKDGDLAPTSAQAKLDTIEKGQEAAKSLTGGGKPTGAPMTLEELSNLEGEDFEKAWDKVMPSTGAGIYG